MLVCVSPARDHRPHPMRRISFTLAFFPQVFQKLLIGSNQDLLFDWHLHICTLFELSSLRGFISPPLSLSLIRLSLSISLSLSLSLSLSTSPSSSFHLLASLTMVPLSRPVLRYKIREARKAAIQERQTHVLEQERFQQEMDAQYPHVPDHERIPTLANDANESKYEKECAEFYRKKRDQVTNGFFETYEGTKALEAKVSLSYSSLLLFSTSP